MSRRTVAIIVVIAVALLAAVGGLLFVSANQSGGECELGFVRTANGCESTAG